MAITCDLCQKRAQVFPVGGAFTPTKTSVYLRTALYDNSAYWNLDDTPVISLANFSSRTSGTSESIYAFDGAPTGFDSKAPMVTTNVGGDRPTLYYPIKAGIAGSFDIYIYYWSSSPLTANILVDGVVEDTWSEALSLAWTWSSAAGTITISDAQQHTLGIQITSSAAIVDKIIIQPAGDPAPGVVTFTDSPYNTVHAQIYTVNASTLLPTGPLAVDDYKNTISDIKNDGWYNFDLNALAAGVTYPNDNYALVLWAAGAREKNYVSWELIDSPDYLDLPVAAED